MSKCTVHLNFFDGSCAECKREYSDLKGLHDIPQKTRKEQHRSSYKEFTEERAKKLYEELILQYIAKGVDELEAVQRARTIIRKQCKVRGIEAWSWVG
ncbi:MAG TPA: hypothetical protein VE130_02645 [Nitrososphaeraceae archaeon]|jgi:alpha-D-ribose 1-methylphosphonate 5-triphosphate diphosphatase PhnM|nr:hypothetical protein [Nitrososphaeraceae archaeon]